MSDLFFCGTLRYGPLLQIVLDRSETALILEPASLSGHAVFWVQDQPYPMIVAQPGGIARGVLVRGLSAADIDRLEFYEGGFDHDLRPVTLQLDDGSDAEALVFFPPPAGGDPVSVQPGEPWSLDDWVAKWGAMTLRAARDVMVWHGRRNASDIVKSIPSIRRRAVSWLRAQARTTESGHDLEQDVSVHNHERPYLNFFAVEEMDLVHRRRDGTLGPLMNRGAFMVGDVAAVLPYDPVRDCVHLIEQFRAPVYMAGDHAPWVWEMVAGLVDADETPEETARREAKEEAGLALQRLEPVAQVFSSTGSSTEFVNLFVGITDLGASVSGGGGVESEGEDIASRIVGFDDLMQAVDEQRFKLMPLVTAALWLARHRDRLRNGA